MTKETFWDDSWFVKDIVDVHGPRVAATTKLVRKLDTKFKTIVGARASETFAGRGTMAVSIAMVTKMLAPAAHGAWQFIGTCWWITEEILLVGFFAEDATIIEDGASTDDLFVATTKG